MEKILKAPTLEEVIVKKQCIQIDGQDEVLREYTLGGPHSLRDVRLILDAEILGHLLEVARESPIRRCILHQAGITMKVRRSKGGHVYETLHLEGRKPVPEHPPSELKIPVTKNEANILLNRWKKK